MTIRRLILGATFCLAAGLVLAPPSKAALNPNGIKYNALNPNALTANGIRPNDDRPIAAGPVPTVDVNGLHLKAFTLPDGRALPPTTSHR